MNLEKKKSSYVQYLKTRLVKVNLVPGETLEQLSDDEVLECYRLKLDGNLNYTLNYTIEQQNQAILENDSNESIWTALCLISHDCPNKKSIQDEIAAITSTEKQPEIPHYIACLAAYVKKQLVQLMKLLMQYQLLLQTYNVTIS